MSDFRLSDDKGVKNITVASGAHMHDVKVQTTNSALEYIDYGAPASVKNLGGFPFISIKIMFLVPREILLP